MNWWYIFEYNIYMRHLHRFTIVLLYHWNYTSNRICLLFLTNYYQECWKIHTLKYVYEKNTPLFKICVRALNLLSYLIYPHGGTNWKITLQKRFLVKTLSRQLMSFCICENFCMWVWVCVCVCINFFQPGIYKIALNNIFQSNISIIIPPPSSTHTIQRLHILSLYIYANSPHLQSWCLCFICWNSSCPPEISTPWTLHNKSEGPHQAQWETDLDIPTCFWVLPVPLFLQERIQLLGCHFCILSHHLIHWEHKRHEVASPLKVILKIFHFLRRSYWDRIQSGYFPS